MKNLGLQMYYEEVSPKKKEKDEKNKQKIEALLSGNGYYLKTDSYCFCVSLKKYSLEVPDIVPCSPAPKSAVKSNDSNHSEIENQLFRSFSKFSKEDKTNETKSSFPKKDGINLNDIWCSSEWDAVTKENVNPHDNVKNNKQDESKLETEHDKHDEHDNVEENCVDYNLKPIIHLTEQTQVSSGTEDETQIHQLFSEIFLLLLFYKIKMKKLYRWSKDTTGEQGWKTRAIESVIELWKSNTTGRLRMICRENLTGKLRLNQNVGKDIVVTEKPSFHCQWSAFDATIAQENGCQGFSMWLAKFPNADTTKTFQRAFGPASN
ncbi:hypothetical protein RFI_21545 [Reticulomyxa filosa]|uniref:RanBD1 domain-containing protein n=1 Tax=Reticulomyxa filosa TaxID=46433 RepID=X6MQU8_RETFI|nr:hypothetical protein RFI_21545 [Reticulomyxa filosa]|eukprot:ETO15817.1 hypothetical protein RFI_21545 [Reticulomyxa filosa]